MESRALTRRKKNLQEDKGRSLEDLPEDILLHILTFLPTLDAVRTSLISRRWRRRKLWRSLTFINFDTIDDVPPRIVEFIDQTLKLRYGFLIQKFRLHLDVTNKISQSKLDKLIFYAIIHMATDLDIAFFYKCRYNFDFGLLRNSRVRKVRFARLDIYGLSSLNLDSIRSVCLNNIIMTDDMVVNLISCCNNLESLALEFCSGMETPRICSSKLKKLSLEDSIGSSLEICCPNLCSLIISNFKMDKYCIKDSASLVEAEVHFDDDDDDEPSDALECWSEVIRLITGVKRLTTQNYWVELLCQKDASLDGCVFQNLNYLELDMWHGQGDLLGLAALFKICPNITTLDLHVLSSLTEYDVPKEFVDKPIEFNIPNLKILNLMTYGSKIEELAELMKKHGTALEKILHWEWNGKISSIPL